LHPLARSLFGRAVLGILIATLVFFGITVADAGFRAIGAAHCGSSRSSWVDYSGFPWVALAPRDRALSVLSNESL
jgi:hypothetical protein